VVYNVVLSLDLSQSCNYAYLLTVRDAPLKNIVLLIAPRTLPISSVVW
jgi:hypothetical protein